MKTNGLKLVITESFIEIIKKVLIFFKGDIKKTRLWLITPNPSFGGIAPLQLIVRGREHKVKSFIDCQAEEGGWAPREWKLGFDPSDELPIVMDGPQLKEPGTIIVREVIE